jgi:hypothetical protein
MKPKPFFFIQITTPPKPWPFSWGPFGRKIKNRLLKTVDAYVQIFQREGAGVTSKPILIDCSSDSRGASCTTTVFFQEANRLRRRTGVQS